MTFTAHVRFGDAVILLALAALLSGVFYAIACLLVGVPPKDARRMRKLGERVATSVFVRKVAGGINRLGRWN